MAFMTADADEEGGDRHHQGHLAALHVKGGHAARAGKLRKAQQATGQARRGTGAERAATPVLPDSEYWRSGSGVAPGTHPDATRIMRKIATIFAINTNCAILRDLAPNFGRNPGAPKFRKTLRETLGWGNTKMT